MLKSGLNASPSDITFLYRLQGFVHLLFVLCDQHRAWAAGIFLNSVCSCLVLLITNPDDQIFECSVTLYHKIACLLTKKCLHFKMSILKI